jgi:hypothetical protein
MGRQLSALLSLVALSTLVALATTAIRDLQGANTFASALPSKQTSLNAPSNLDLMAPCPTPKPLHPLGEYAYDSFVTKIKDLYDASDLVVLAKFQGMDSVTDMTDVTRFDPAYLNSSGPMPYTVYSFEVLDTYKGDKSATIAVGQPGGVLKDANNNKVAGDESDFVGLGNFVKFDKPGTEHVLFLKLQYRNITKSKAGLPVYDFVDLAARYDVFGQNVCPVSSAATVFNIPPKTLDELVHRMKNGDPPVPTVPNPYPPTPDRTQPPPDPLQTPTPILGDTATQPPAVTPGAP